MDSPHLPAAFLHSLEPAGQAHPTGAHELASVPPTPVLAWSPKEAGEDSWDGTLCPTLAWFSPGVAKRLRDAKVPQGRAPSPSPPPGWCSPHPRALWVSCDRNSCLNEHALCPIIMRLLQRQWPVEARPAWGLRPWEAPCTWAWRWVKGGGLVVLATPEACPRVLGPALQDPLSASSLTGSPPGSVWARLTARGRGSGRVGGFHM